MALAQAREACVHLVELCIDLMVTAMPEAAKAQVVLHGERAEQLAPFRDEHQSGGDPVFDPRAAQVAALEADCAGLIQ